MPAKLWRLVPLLGAVLGGVGCVSLHEQGFQQAFTTPVEVAAPLPARSQVYLFMMNGADVFEVGGMRDLREQLARAGFHKVYHAQRPDSAWYALELRRLAREEPDARFVLLAYGPATDKVYALAAAAQRDNLPVSAVVFLDPVGLNLPLPEALTAHSVVLRSHNWPGSRELYGHENLVAPNVGHAALPSHAATQQLVHRVLSAVSGTVQVPSPFAVPRLPLADHPNPTPRRVDPATLATPPDEWDFLKPAAQFPDFAANPCWCGF